MRLSRPTSLTLLIALCLSDESVFAAQFKGRVVVEWLRHDGSDREMKLLEPFAFIDDAGKRWDVPAGAIVDGASIPPVFWNSIGPPFVGDYRYASVVHDYYCQTHTETWEATHRLFYDACIAGGVSEVKAKLMYAAVFAGGPRWKVIKMRGLEGIETFIVSENPPGMTDLQFAELRSKIERDNPTLKEIEDEIRRNTR